jgi:superfamily II DNA or RNA helicase
VRASEEVLAEHADRVVIDWHFKYLPKSSVNVRVLRYGLAYGDAPSEAVVLAHHVRVPLHFPVNVTAKSHVLAQPTFRKWDPPTAPVTELRAHQHAPLDALKSHGSGVLNLGCGYGKTVVALHYAASVGVRTLVVVNQINLISQWADEARVHLGMGADRVGTVRAGKWDYDKDLVIGSIHTLSGTKTPAGFHDNFGLVIFDECHHLSAPTFKELAHHFCGERVGLSATPSREDGLEQVFLNHLGPVVYSKTDQELVPRIIFARTRVPETLSQRREVCDTTGQINHRRLCAALGADPERDALCKAWVQLLRDAGHHVLCLSHSVEHVERLAAEIPECGLAAGSVAAEERAAQIRAHKVSVATLDIAAEALNVPSLSALVVLTPFGAKLHGNILQQALGRIQRRHEGKLHPVAVFLEDSEIGMCRGLIHQIKRVLRTWGYEHETRKPDAPPSL